MPKRLDGGYTTPQGKKLIGVYMSQAVFDWVTSEADKRGVSASAFICILLYSLMNKESTKEDGLI